MLILDILALSRAVSIFTLFMVEFADKKACRFIALGFLRKKAKG